VEFHAAQDGRAAADKAFALIEDSATPPPGTRTVSARGAVIVLDGLSVAGRDGYRPYGLSAVIQPGRVTVLTGANGTGKSTTLQVITGITAASNGGVTVAGVEMTDIEPSSWWRQLSWLPQRPVLIPGTVADNLALFGPLADIDNACGASGFDSVMGELPDGLRTVIGRAGVGLTLGKRQPLCLARALGSAAPVLLLDEPTAHLDGATEARVLRAIVERARAGATIVVVGHREQVVGIADHVIEVAAARDIHHARV